MFSWFKKPKPELDVRDLLRLIWTRAEQYSGDYDNVMANITYRPPPGFNVESLWFTRKVSEACFAYKEFMCK